MSYEEVVLVLVEAIEAAGVVVITITSLMALYKYLTELPNPRFAQIRLDLARGLTLGLEFKIGSEIIRTVIVTTFLEIGFLAAIIAVRGVLNFMIEKDVSDLKARADGDQ